MRLHYNRLYTYLDGDLDAVEDTNIPIVDPLREGGIGGTDIPSVVAPDTLDLAVDDEIITVTAYTTGTSVLTSVLRGQGDTDPATHDNGKRIFNGPVKEDFFDVADIKGPMVLTIASVDAPQFLKDRADYVCDGVADQVQIQAAIDEIESWDIPSGRIEFSPGLFYIAAAFVPDFGYGSNIDFVGTTWPGWGLGESGGTIFVRTGVANFPVMDPTGGGTYRFADITIHDPGDDANTSPLMLLGGSSVTMIIERCFVMNWQGTGAGVQWTGNGTMIVKDSYIEGPDNSILCSDSSIINLDIFLYDTDLWADFNIACGGGCNFILDNVNVDGMIRIDGNTASTPMPKVRIVGGSSEGSVESLYLSDISEAMVDNHRIEMAGGGALIRFNNVDKGHIRGCDVSYSGHHGIWLNDCDYIKVQDNTVAFLFSQLVDATYSGIILDGNTNDCLVEGNVIRTAGANKWLYGIRVDDSTCDNNTVINNDLLTSSKTAGNEFSDAGTGTVAGLEPTLLTGWYQDNVVASQTNVALALPTAGRTELIMPADGYVVGVVVRSNAARVAGTLSAEATINGSQVVTATLDGTNTTVKATRQSSSADKFTAGQRVGVVLTTDAGWLPVTADIDVTVLVVFNTANRV